MLVLQNKSYFKSKVDWIEVFPEQKLILHMINQTSKEYEWKSSRSDSWTPEMKEQARVKALKHVKGKIQNG